MYLMRRFQPLNTSLKNCNTLCREMAQVCLSSNLSPGNNQDGDLVSSKCIQTFDGQCYTIQSYIAGDRLR